MNYEHILYEIEDEVAMIKLNRPDVLNALNPQMTLELIDGLKRSNADDGVKIILITGKGRAFCAGADMHMFEEATKGLQEKEDPLEELRERREGATSAADLTKLALESKPIIGAINGPAVGLGVTMTLSWDIRLASEKASFQVPFVRLGLVPEAGSSFFLPRLVGFSKACEILYSGRSVDAEEASEMGLVNNVLPTDELMSRSLEMSKKFCESPSKALNRSRELLVNGSFFNDLDESMSLEEEYFLRCQASPEHRKAVEEFLEDK